MLGKSADTVSDEEEALRTHFISNCQNYMCLLIFEIIWWVIGRKAEHELIRCVRRYTKGTLAT